MSKIKIKDGEISSSSGIDININSTSSLFVSQNGIGVFTDTPNATLDLEKGHILLPELISAPSLPTPGKGALYISSSDSRIYFKNDLGDVYDLTSTATVSGAVIQSVTLPALYDREIHVSPLSGSDISGDGTTLKPFATLAKAISVGNNGGQQIVLHPGTYREDASISKLNVTICAAQGSNGGEVFVSGTLTILGNQSSTRLYGLSILNVQHSGNGSLYVDTCQIDNFTKNANAYCYINDTDINYNCTLSGSGIFSINGGHICQLGSFEIVGSDVTASVKSCLNLRYPVINGGYFGAEGSNLFSTSSSGYAISASATSIVDLINCYCADVSGLVAPVYLAGASGYANTVFNKTNSFLTADSISAYALNRTPLFQTLVSNVVTGSNITGSVAKFTTITGSNVTGSVAKFTSITGSSLMVAATSSTTAAANNPIVNIKNYEWIGTGTTNTTSGTAVTVATIATSANTGYYLEADIIARQTNSTNQTNIYKVAYRAKNNGGTITGAATQLLVSEEVASWDATIASSGTNILIQVVGATGSNITWKCIYKVREV